MKLLILAWTASMLLGAYLFVEMFQHVEYINCINDGKAEVFTDMDAELLERQCKTQK